MEAIVGTQFPTKVIPLIDDAKESIKIVVFDWRWYPNDPANPVQLFNQSLIRAVRRGVKIEAIGNCDEVIKILKDNGIVAKKAITKNLVHAKMMIFDDKDVVLGSHNFTQSGFSMNHEISIYVPDCPKIADFIKFFKSLWLL